MTIKLYGSMMTSAFRCHALAKEIDLAFEECEVDLANPSPEFLKLNPNGKVPCLVDGDFVIWESMAINRYLAATRRPDLLGGSLQDQGLIDQWSYWAILELQPDMFKAIMQLFAPKEQRDPAVIEEAKTNMAPRHKILDDHLQGKTYMLGDAFTLADINVGSVAMLNRMIKNDLSAYANLEAWLNRLTQHRAFG